MAKLRFIFALLMALVLATSAGAVAWPDVWTGRNAAALPARVESRNSIYLAFPSAVDITEFSPVFVTSGRTTVCYNGGGTGTFNLLYTTTVADTTTDVAIVHTFGPSAATPCAFFGPSGRYYIDSVITTSAVGTFHVRVD